MSTRCRRRSDSLSLAVIAYTVIMAVAYVMYLRFAPVIMEFQIHHTQTVKEGITLTGTLNKTRSCVLESLAITSTIDNIHQRLWVEFPDMPAVPTGTVPNRPTGKQFWGPWTVYLTGSEEEINLIALHRCEWGILVPTRLITQFPITHEVQP